MPRPGVSICRGLLLSAIIQTAGKLLHCKVQPFTFTCEWGNKSLQSRNIPQWLLDKDLWIRSKGVTDTVMVAINKTIDFFGEGIGVHTYYWHNYPYDTHYPDYFPAKPEFEGMILPFKSGNVMLSLI